MPLKPSDILDRKNASTAQELVNIIDKKLIDVYDPVSGSPFTFQFKPETPRQVVEEIVRLYQNAGWNVGIQIPNADNHTVLSEGKSYIDITKCKVFLTLEPGDIRTDLTYEIVSTLSMRELMGQANYVNTSLNQVKKMGVNVDKDCIIEVRSTQMNSEGTQGRPVSRSLSLVSLLRLLKVNHKQASNAAEGLKAYETGEENEFHAK